MKKYSRFISILLLIVTIFLVSKFSMINGFDLLMLMYPFLLAIVIVMLYKKNSIQKYKHIYNIILLIILIPSLLFLLIFIYNNIICIIDSTCYASTSVNLNIVLLLILFTLLLLNVVDIKQQQNSVNFLLTCLVSLIVIIIYLRYNFDINFIHNYIYQNQYEIQDSYIYITQNYIYFDTMYICLLINYFINKNNFN